MMRLFETICDGNKRHRRIAVYLSSVNKGGLVVPSHGMQGTKRIHVIAIGGAIMHNLAIALSRKGYNVTGSDDAINDPSKTNLAAAGLLPSEIGWETDKIIPEIDIVILGMHARSDNPELLAAKNLGLKIMSFPEFVAQESENKKRIVIAGSHGKTTTTAMIMHVLRKLNLDFDYVVGSSIDGFDLSVKLSNAPLIVIEGDEYLTSPLDLRSKFLWYQPHLSIITGVAYDHINVFPTWESYVDTFKKFIETLPSDAKYFWYAEDETLVKLSKHAEVKNESYTTPIYENTPDGTMIFAKNGERYNLEIVGKHNLENLRAAEMVCGELGISPAEFYRAVSDFTGAGRRMEKIYSDNDQVVYRDFAHSPSKLKATTSAIKETYGGSLLAVFELHTFSSLTESFLPLYYESMQAADKAIVYFSKDVFVHKKMPVLSKEYIQDCFGDVQVINEKDELEPLVNTSFAGKENILMMSSGIFSGAKFDWV